MFKTRKRKPFKFEGFVPYDKSITHRALILGLIASGETIVEGFSKCRDCLNTLNCLKKLGSEIEIKENILILKSKGINSLKTPLSPLYVGNSGTTIRLLLGALAGSNVQTVTISGDSSIKKRPMLRVINPLRKMGALIYNNTAPLTLRGKKLKGISYTIPMPSAQVKSSLLLAALNAEGKTILKGEILSRDHTERLLPLFGCEIQKTTTTLTVKPTFLKAAHIKIPGDISSASFLLALPLLVKGSIVTLKNVGLNITRLGILNIFKKMGASVDIKRTSFFGLEPVGDVTVELSGNLYGVEVKKEEIPFLIDEIPLLAVVATQAIGKTIIEGVEELRFKESNRLKAILLELKKLGVEIACLKNNLIITGPTKIKGGVVWHHNDHRIAMSLAIAGFASEIGVTVDGIDIAAISFPGFKEYLEVIKNL